MSLDIRVKKKIPNNKTLTPQPVVKQPAKLIVENKINKQPPQPPVDKKKKSKNNIWWWLLFIVLFLLFVGVIYFIWRDSQTSISVKTVKPKQAPPGIVSNFATETVTPQNSPDDTPTSFNINLLTERVAEFDKKASSFLFTLTTTSSTSTLSETTKFNKSFFDLVDSTGILADFLSNQYESLRVLAQANPNYNQTVDYLTSIENYINRIEGERQVLDALVALEENENFANEITISLKNLNDYFKQVRNLSKLVDQILVGEVSDQANELIDIGATTTTTTISTSTESQMGE